jgi:SAM-dependent methyltransferase
MNSHHPKTFTPPSEPDFYDLIAPIYDRHWGRAYFSLASSLFESRIATQVPSGGRILDLCCGSGRFADFLSRSGYRVTGVDSSPALLAQAAQQAPGARLMQADMSEFALPETFDAAVCLFNSLNHARDEGHLRLIFSRVARHLEPSAPFLFDVIPEEDYLHSWKSDEYILAAEGLYELSYSYFAHTRVATCRVRLRSRHDPGSVRAEAASEQRPLSSIVIHRALQCTGFVVVSQEQLGRAHPPDSRRLVLAKRV